MDSARVSKPNFLIAGAVKSGTTSLYFHLKEHPEVFMPKWPHKEPAFFSPPEVGGITEESRYLELFDGAAGHKRVGEASVSYLYAENAPARIKSYLGSDTKIIILLRNPVDLAYSLWGHQVREGFEDLPFEEALAQEEYRISHPEFARQKYTWCNDYAYTRRGIYMPQLARYEALFPPENIKIFIFEEFFSEGLPHWDSLCDFLGIDRSFRPSNEEKKYNAAGKMRSLLLRRILRERMGWKEPIKRFMPQKTRIMLRNWLEYLNRVESKNPPMNDALRQQLQKVFFSDVRALERKLGHDLSKVWF